MVEISSISIVLNEGPYIGEWIDYHKNMFGEMIIVDGGSTDNTVEIIKSKGIIPHFRQWDNDFSKQRNFSIEKANFDWVFVLDVDHRVSPELVSHFEELTNDSAVACYEVQFVYIVDGKDVGYPKFMNFFRKSSGITYWREIHEGICDKDGVCVKEHKTLPDDWCVYHIKTLDMVKISLDRYASYGKELGGLGKEDVDTVLKTVKEQLGYE